MKSCPSLRELEQLLDEELMDSQHAALAKHVDSCLSCQDLLERLTETTSELQKLSLLEETKRDQARGGHADSRIAFLAHLKEQPPSLGPKAELTAATAETLPVRVYPVVDGYEILGELGRGGMGVVYKARHVALDRLVALKMILAATHAGPKELARFRQEAAAIARLHHPNIVQVFDIGDAEGRPYFALEYVEQGSLARYLRGDLLPLPTILTLIETLARTMAYAHQCGIIHRDLKPANILIGAKEKGLAGDEDSFSFVLDSSYTPKITDFGLAKRLDAEEVGLHSEEVLGTPSYMAPEQADAKVHDIGPATDVYSLGAIFYEMLTGRPPFKGATSLETMLQVLHEEPVRPGRLRPKLPRDVEIICLKCLEKDPARRYASASALADDLRRCRRGDPIEARPVGFLERGWKWARRRPAFAALILGIVLVTLLGFTGVTWQWLVAVDERNNKEFQRQQAEFQRQQARNALYYSNISQSQLQWRVNDLAGAMRSLEECIPRSGDHRDRRGWEWYYLQTLYRPELFSFDHSRPGKEGGVAFAPTGRMPTRRMLVSVVRFPPDDENAGSEIRLWDTISGNLIYAQKLVSPFDRVAFHPDGRRLILGGTDGKIAAWDTTKHEALWQAFLPECQVTGLAFSPDGKTVATAGMASSEQGKRGVIKLWDMDTGQATQLLRASETVGFHCVAFHPTLPLLASGGEANTVRIWDLRSGTEVRSLTGHKSAIYGVVFSPDGKLLVSTGSNGDLKIWNLEPEKAALGAGLTSDAFVKGRIVPQSLTGRTGAILGLAFSPDSRYFAYSGTDKTVRVWDVDSGAAFVTFRGHTGVVESVQFSPDGQRLVSSSPARGEVKVWDLTRHPDYSTLVRTAGDLDHPGLDLVDIAFHEDGRHLVSVTVAGELQTWDAFSGVLRAQHSLPISAEPVEIGGVLAAFGSGGRRLAGRCREDLRLVRIWDVERGEELLTFRGHHLPVYCLFYSPDGRYLATCACDDKPSGKPFEIKIWDAATGKQLAEMDGQGQVFAVVFSPNNQWLAIGNDNLLRVYDWAARREIVPPLVSHKSNITAVVFHPDGSRLATVALNDPEIHIWDSSEWRSQPKKGRQPLERLPGSTQMSDLVFSPDGKRLVAANRDLVKMWDVETGKEVLTLRGAPQRYGKPPFNARIVFHPNGLRLAGANWNESISVWDAPMPSDDEDRRDEDRRQLESVRRLAADERAVFWHLEEAEYCAEHQMNYAARFHLERLSGATLPPLLQERVERILPKMEKLPE